MQEIIDYWKGRASKLEQQVVELMAVGNSAEANKIADTELSWTNAQVAMLENLFGDKNGRLPTN